MMKAILSLSIVLAGLFLILALGLLAVTGLPAAPAEGSTCDRYVVSGGSNSTACASSAAPCKTIQYALEQAASGDRICVADRSDVAGATTYSGTVVVTKSVTLDGGWATQGVGEPFNETRCPSQNVIIDGQGLQRAISITGSIAPTIRCFVITGGNADGQGGNPSGSFENDAGGGIFAINAAPIIERNVITGNHACEACSHYGIGGGVYLRNAPATAIVQYNVIDSNAGGATLLGWGGGIALRDSSAQVFSNTIQRNTGGTVGNGGGIYVEAGSPTIVDNRLLTNTAATSVMAHGGGIFIDSDTVVTVERNLIQGNVALRGTASSGLFSRGGGIFYDGPLATIRDNEVYGNVASLLDQRGLGGGMYLHGLSASAVVAGNVVANENRASYNSNGSGGGLYLDESYATVADNRVFNNTASSETPGYGGGMYVNGGGGLIQGNIITGNMAVLGAVSGWGWGGGVAISMSTALVQDNLIAGNIADSAPNAIGVGGGVYVWGGAPQLVRNEVLSNTTSGGGGGFGGGLALSGSRFWLDGNTIVGNRSVGPAGDGGGGVNVASCAHYTFTNNIVARNTVSTTGSGIAIAGSGAITGSIAYNTIAANEAGDGVGVTVGPSSWVLLYNNIIVSQTVGITNVALPTSTVTADHTLFAGNGLNYGSGVTSLNEVGGPAGLKADYHLTGGSNAIGHAITLTWVTRDIDGDPRPLGLPDVGADEYVAARIYLPLVLRNF